MKTLQSRDNLIWIDLEMTGLNPDKEKIIEIATLVTDSDLNIIAEGPNLIISQPKEILDAMDEWNTNQHGLSGLTEEVSNSNITEQVAEIETLDFVSKYVGENTSPMCGNTVSHDRRFLSKYMPRLEAYFNYRHIDVSSFKEVAVRWMNEAQAYEKKGSHRALGDIKESVEELKFYKKLFMPRIVYSFVFDG
jgi:Oligoribonuclease (3''->5'' exoribonuclease)